LRIAVLCVLLAAVGVGFTSRGGGGDVPLELSASMSPTTIDFPGTQEILYRLELTTGSTPQQVRVALRLPVYARGGGTPPRTAAPGAAPVGSPVQLLDRPTLEGTGRIVAFDPPLSVAVAGRTPCLRGYPETSPAVVTLDLPAKAQATLVARVETGRAAPWPDTDYRLAFAVAVGTPAGRSVIVRSPAPELTGRRGTRIRMHVRPGRRPSAGQPVRIGGSLSPAVAGARLTLWHAAVRQPANGAIYVEGPDFPRDYEHPRRLGSVVADTRGQFLSNAWVPLRRRGIYGGDYAVWATYRPAAPQQVRERTCPLLLSIR
jgi:hypothetical protein